MQFIRREATSLKQFNEIRGSERPPSACTILLIGNETIRTVPAGDKSSWLANRFVLTWFYQNICEQFRSDVENHAPRL